MAERILFSKDYAGQWYKHSSLDPLYDGEASMIYFPEKKYAVTLFGKVKLAGHTYGVTEQIPESEITILALKAKVIE